MSITLTFSLTVAPPGATAWTSTDLLRRFKRMAGIAEANEEDDDLDLYPILSAAENEVIREIAARYPHALYGHMPPTLLTPSSDRKTFSFGTDAHGNAVLPMGWVQISPRKTAFNGESSYYWREGLEFLDEGIQIRMPGNRAYAGELWGRWIPTAPGISATSEPVLQPADARELVVIKAVEMWALEGNTRPDLVAAMQQAWGSPVVPKPGKFASWMLTYKRRFRGGGGLDPALWWLYSPDLGRNG